MCSRSKSDAKRHHFHPHASMTKHAPESNERDYAVYKIWQAKRHMTHMAGEEGLSLIDPPLHLQNDCFPLTTLGSDNIESCWELRLLTWHKGLRGVKKSLQKVLRLWHNWCIQARRDTQTQTPPHPRTPLCRSDRMHDRNEALLWTASHTQTLLFVTQKREATQNQRKSQIEFESKVSAELSEQKSEISQKISINLGRRRPCRDPCGVSGKMVSCKKKS